MLKTALSAALFAAAVGTASTGLAESWGVGVGVGIGAYPHGAPPPGYYPYGPPPPYYGRPAYRQPPLGYHGEGRWVILGPAPRALDGGVVMPDDVFDLLEAWGYREFGPMARRGPLYRLSAVNPVGDHVALEVSAYTGLIERELILAEGSPSPRPQPATPPPAASGRDPLVVY
ncbi:MAG: hypothetical protein ACRED5_20775 [Propylenella sp.]